MTKTVFYAMEPSALQKYADWKNLVSAETVDLSSGEIKRITGEIQAARADGRELFSLDEEGTAHITVAGPLEPKPDVCAIMFDLDMTTYADIIKATEAAEADNNIKKIVYHFDSPGGNVVGLFKAADSIRNTTKPTLGINHGLCASAAYALASQCDEIVCENISSETGSIGVATEILDFSGQEKGRGVTRYILTSENAENKRPDVTTQEGRDKIIARLTDIESVFVEYVALGRDTTIENVKESFGRGGVLIARDAVSAGMVDSIESEIQTEPRDTTGPENQIEGEESMGEVTMSEEQLKKFGEDIAKSTATAVRQEITAEMDDRDQKRTAEAKRVAGFTTLKDKFPGMSSMIDEEMKREGAVADVAFALKVADADKARLAESENQQQASEEQASPAKPSGNESKDNSGNETFAAFAGSM